MIIEANEKFTQEEIDEVFEISLRRNQYYKDPAKNYPNPFKETYKNLIFGIVMLAVTSVLGVITKFNVFCIIAMTLCAVMILVSIMWLVLLKKQYKEMKANFEKDDRHSKIEVTEELIAVEMGNGTTVKIKWPDVEFIKVFKTTVVVFASDKTRALIIPLKYWDGVAKFMEDNNIIVKFYR